MKQIPIFLNLFEPDAPEGCLRNANLAILKVTPCFWNPKCKLGGDALTHRFDQASSINASALYVAKSVLAISTKPKLAA